MKKLWLIALWASFTHAANFGDYTVLNVNRVYDGDTFFADIRGLAPVAGEDIGIRINAIDTPEIKGSQCPHERAKAHLAKAYLYTRLKHGRHIVIRNVKRGKYFRLVADVYIDGNNVAQEMLDKHLAIGYYGGKKRNVWCN